MASLSRQMTVLVPVEAWVYEPTPSLMTEAKVNLAGLDSVIFTDALDSVDSGIFDYVFCLEVFEHLPKKETIAAIEDIHRLLKPDGIAVIGVPHELFLPALFKGLFRTFRRHGGFDASPWNILGAVLGHPPVQRPTVDISQGLPFHIHHLGFDYRVLEHTLQESLQLSKKWFSPFPLLGAAFNSEVYFLLRKTQPALAADVPL